MPKAQAKAATETKIVKDFIFPEDRKAAPRNPEQLAGENGTPIEEYARRLLSAQAVDLSGTFKLARVERGLIAQGYPRAEIRKAVESIAEALDLA